MPCLQGQQCDFGHCRKEALTPVQLSPQRLVLFEPFALGAVCLVEQQPAFLKGFPQSRHMKTRRGCQIQIFLPEHAAQFERCAVELYRIDLAVQRIKLTPRKYVGAAKNFGLAVPPEQQDLQTLGPIAQQNYSGCIKRGRANDFMVDWKVHPRIVSRARRQSTTVAAIGVTFATVGSGGSAMRCIQRFLLGLSLWAMALAALSQPIKLQCEVEGKFVDAEGKATANRVAIELQVIGKHLYFTVVGPKPYEMRVSTLVTEEYEGVNLTSSSQLGARRRHRSSGQETSLLIERGSIELSAHNDVMVQGRLQRFKYTGKCRQIGS